MEQMATWTPRRSLALVIGQVLLAVAALLITGGLDAASLGYFPDAWVASLGITVAVLGANWLNLAFWYPAIRGTPRNMGQRAPAPFSEEEAFIARLIVGFQFYECGVVLVLQLVAGIVAIITARSLQDASPWSSLGGLGGMVSVLPALLGAVLNYVLSRQAHRIVWPPPVDAEASSGVMDVPSERAEWYASLGPARGTHTMVIGALVLLVLPALSVRFGEVVTSVAVGILTLVVVALFLRGAQRELRHLVRVREEIR